MPSAELKRQKEQSEDTQKIPGDTNGGANNSNPINNAEENNNNNYYKNKKDRSERKPKTVYPPCETSGKINHSQEKFYYGGNAANRPPSWHRRPENQNQVQQ